MEEIYNFSLMTFVEKYFLSFATISKYLILHISIGNRQFLSPKILFFSSSAVRMSFKYYKKVIKVITMPIVL